MLDSTEGFPVITMTRVSGERSRSSARRSIPPTPGM
jgi:hypothetical protein